MEWKEELFAVLYSDKDGDGVGEGGDVGSGVEVECAAWVLRKGYEGFVSDG